VARYSFCVLAVLLLAGLSVAQSSDRVEVFGGYSYMAPDFISTAPSGGSGWHVSATVKVARHVGIVADFSGFAPTNSAVISASSPSVPVAELTSGSTAGSRFAVRRIGCTWALRFPAMWPVLQSDWCFASKCSGWRPERGGRFPFTRPQP
jgi:hypothetical protein